jgi:DNA polymerase/3'-5' exonuclease PolX
VIAAIVIESDLALWLLGGLVLPVFAAWLQNTRRMARVDAKIEAMAEKVDNVDNAVNHGRMQRMEQTVNDIQIRIGTLNEHVMDMRVGAKEAADHLFTVGVDGAENGATIIAHAARLSNLEQDVARHDKRIGRLEVASSSSR